MRGLVSAIYLFSLSLCGIGLGPLVVAGFTDYAFGRDDAINYSLALTILIAAPISAALLWLARRPYREALTRNTF